MGTAPLKILVGCALLAGTACKSTQTAPPPAPLAPSPTAFAPGTDPEVRAVAEREIARRQQATLDALDLLEQGNRLQAEGDLEGARRAYQQSMQKKR